MDFREKLIPDICNIVEEYLIEYGDWVIDIYPRIKFEKTLKNFFGDKAVEIYKKYNYPKFILCLLQHIK